MVRKSNGLVSHTAGGRGFFSIYTPLAFTIYVYIQAHANIYIFIHLRSVFIVNISLSLSLSLAYYISILFGNDGKCRICGRTHFVSGTIYAPLLNFN